MIETNKIEETTTFFNELTMKENEALLLEFEKKTPMLLYIYDEHEIIIDGVFCDDFAEFLKLKNVEFRLEFNQNVEEFNEINAMRIRENSPKPH